MNKVNKMNEVQEDKIDLFELLQELWDGKWLISTFILIAVLLGSSLVLVKEKGKAPVVYESKLAYSIDMLPPFYDEGKVLTDFHKNFYSIDVFEGWKKRDGNVSIAFEDFSGTEVVDGFVLSKSGGGRLAEVNRSFVLIKSNQLPVLDEFFKYANYINELLKDEYVVRANEELQIIDARLKRFPGNHGNMKTVLSIDRYISRADKGASVLDIQRPTIPKLIEPNSTTVPILVLSVVFGGTIGGFFVLDRNAINRRKDRLSKVDETV